MFIDCSVRPTVQFSEDESIACRLVTNEVHFFDGHDFAKGIVDRLRLSGIDGVQLSSSPPSHIATYVPEIKVSFFTQVSVHCSKARTNTLDDSGCVWMNSSVWNIATFFASYEDSCLLGFIACWQVCLACQGAPASVQIFERTQVSQAQPVARRSFFKSNTAQLTWNKGSTGVLVLATSDVDKTNQSYYGESRLHFLTSDGRHEGAVPLSKLNCFFFFFRFMQVASIHWRNCWFYMCNLGGFLEVPKNSTGG